MSADLHEATGGPDGAGGAPSVPVPPVLLDAVALGRLRELDPDGRLGVVQRVMTAFDTTLSRMLVQLAAEREDGNPGVVMSVAHTLKSSSAAVGALVLSRTCGDVERRLRDGVPGDLGADVERLVLHGEAALQSVRAMLRG